MTFLYVGGILAIMLIEIQFLIDKYPYLTGSRGNFSIGNIENGFNSSTGEHAKTCRYSNAPRMGFYLRVITLSRLNHNCLFNLN